MVLNTLRERMTLARSYRLFAVDGTGHQRASLICTPLQMSNEYLDDQAMNKALQSW